MASSCTNFAVSACAVAVAVDAVVVAETVEDAEDTEDADVAASVFVVSLAVFANAFSCIAVPTSTEIASGVAIRSCLIALIASFHFLRGNCCLC